MTIRARGPELADLAAIALMLAAGVLFMTLATAQQIPTATCLNADARERARGLILEGIDAALKQHTVTVFESWLKDPSEQPARAIRGLRNGISAYSRARAAALNWHFPLCKPE